MYPMPKSESRDAAEPAETDGSPPNEPAPMNRAERRKKGKSGAAAGYGSPSHGVSGRSTPANTQRNWASRRTG
jgi:hypothetical protein